MSLGGCMLTLRAICTRLSPSPLQSDRALVHAARGSLLHAYASTRSLRTGSNIAPMGKPATESASLLQQYSVLGAPSTLGKMVSSVGNNGFVVKDLRVIGPVGEFDSSGNPSNLAALKDDITPPFFYGWSCDMFKIFEIVDPTPDILVLGTGSKMERLPPSLRKYLGSLGMQVEVLSSRQAAATYNVLLQEGRKPAVALLPNVPTSARTGKALVELLKRGELEGVL
ncbi:hypothetical protein BSLG_003228 [Batrachochytrium salamandrivorans]|nr:hypothetical protein BSLG_003228 [Batrachochytrium salamandrivorans]